jgi:hypothetical protein
MFGLSFHKPSPDQLSADEFQWPMNEQQRQERLSALRAHVQELRKDPPEEGIYEPLPAPRAVPFQPEPMVAPSLPWSSEAPTQPGLYWWRVRGLDRRLREVIQPKLAMVVLFGGTLSVRTRKGDSSAFVSVSALARDWAGPLPLPEDARLEDLEIS